MAVTLVEVGAQYGAPLLKTGVAKIIAQNSPILDRIPNKQFQGSAYQFQIESALPPAQWRAVGANYVRGSGYLIRITENVSILGNEVFVDNFEIKVAANKKDLKARKFQEISRSIALEYDNAFFSGDSHINPLQFDGLRTRIQGNQLLNAGANGATMTLDMLDQMLDLVVVDAAKVLYMNRTLRRKVTALARAQTGTVRVSIPSLDNFGKQVVSYDDVPILIVERTDDGSTLLDFTETLGTCNNCASIYCVSYGDEERLFGLLGAGGDLDVQDLGVSELAPGVIGRVELYPGIGIAHPRCVSRLRGITNS